MWSCDFERNCREKNAQDGLRAICLSSEESFLQGNPAFSQTNTDFHANGAHSQVLFLIDSGHPLWQWKLRNVFFLRKLLILTFSFIVVCFSLSCSYLRCITLRCYVVVRKLRTAMSINSPLLMEKLCRHRKEAARRRSHWSSHTCRDVAALTKWKRSLSAYAHTQTHRCTQRHTQNQTGIWASVLLVYSTQAGGAQ